MPLIRSYANGGRGPAGNVNGTGSADHLAKWITEDEVGDSTISEVEGNVTIDGNLEITGTITIDTEVLISGSGTTGKVPKFTDTAAIGDSLTSDDGTTVTVGGNFEVTNLSTFDDDVDMKGDATVEIDLDVGGVTTVNELDVNGAANLNSGVAVTGTATVGGVEIATGTGTQNNLTKWADTNGGLVDSIASDDGSTLTVTGDLSVTGDISGNLGIPLLQSKTQRIQFSDLTDAVLNEAQTINIDSALPAGAVIIGHEVKLDTDFDGMGLVSLTLDVGGADTTALVGSFDVKNSTDGGKRYSPGYSHKTFHGSHCTGVFDGEQLVATFTPNGIALNALTAGDLTITVWYFA